MTMPLRPHPIEALLIPGFISLLLAAGCSSAKLSPQEAHNNALSEAAHGPSILYTRAEPGTIELNRDLQPLQHNEVLADIKDFNSRIKDVRLQFVGIPLEIPMENIGGGTWRAQLTPRQLELLSVSGRTIRYEAKVVARDEKGDVGMAQTPLEVAIKTPEVAPAGVGSG